MEASQQIPPEVQQVADTMGVDPHELMAQLSQQQSAPEQSLPPLPGAEAGVATAEGVKAAPAETREQQLERELAVSQQELQQTRQLARVESEGRVIGNSGIGPGGSQPEPPNLGSIEPGIRWAYFNGLISDEDIEQKVGPLLAGLLKAHQGGVI